MKNSLVLEQEYQILIQRLSLKDQIKVYDALFSYARGENVTNLKKEAKECYDEIISLMANKIKEVSETNRLNALKRWKSKNATASTDVCDRIKNECDRIEEPCDRIKNLCDRIQTPINKQSMVREGQNNQRADDCTDDIERGDSSNRVNNINNINSKNNNIINNNISSVPFVKEKININNNIISERARVNIFNTQYSIIDNERVKEKSEEERKPFLNLFADFFEHCVSKTFYDSAIEIIDTIIEASNEAKTVLGLKFNHKVYKNDELMLQICALSVDKFRKIVQQLVYNEDIKNRPCYILGAILCATKINEERELSLQPSFP